MLTNFSRKNMIQSIMLTTGFSKKSLETFFYESHFWTFLKCPFSKKIFLSFKTCFSIIYNNPNITDIFTLLRYGRVTLSNRHHRPSNRSNDRFQFIDPFLLFANLAFQFLGILINLMNIQAGFRDRILVSQKRPLRTTTKQFRLNLER